MEHRTDQERSDQLAADRVPLTVREFLLLRGLNPEPYMPELHDDDVLELVLSGGCAVCEYEADEMCVGCGSCACDRHDGCVRPDEKQLGGAA